MQELMTPGTGIVFMKVGTHAGESLESIIERKRRELAEAGQIFWGYGGPTCHPVHHVQPFVKELQEAHAPIYLVMEPMNSRHFAEQKPAAEYSDDGVTWHSVPKGINVLGSRYALVLDSLDTIDADIDLSQLRVGIGTSSGKVAAEYVQGHVDKGCFIVQPGPLGEAPLRHIGLVATLASPYAVLLK